MSLSKFLLGVVVGCGITLLAVYNNNITISRSRVFTTTGKNLKVNINGKSYDGNNVKISNNKIYVDSKEQTDNLKPNYDLIINVTGDVIDRIDTIGSVTVNGNCNNIKTTDNVKVTGNSGNIHTVGDVTVFGSSGRINTVGKVNVGKK